MSKGFKGTKKRKRKGNKLFFFVMFLFGFVCTFIYLDNNLNKISDKNLVRLLLGNVNLDEYYITDLIKMNEYIKSNALLLDDFYKEEVEDVSADSYSPVIYIYNTHQSEEYGVSNFVEFSVKPTVIMASYILEDVFKKNNLDSLVEERSIKDILTSNGWKYNSSYRASRLLMEDSYSKYKSLKYFIDVHRDSLNKDKTTVLIDGKSYAKILFLIGLDNNKYLSNLEFTEKINNKINEKYPGLSKGIYKKGGEGVNGIYNQDFSPYTILIEIGGFESGTIEVLNTSLAFAECFMEVIKNV